MRSVLPTPNSSLPTPPSGAIKRRQAFTLIEMIIVIAIISSLLALLYGALERAQKFSRRTITYTELKNIESAFKQYHAHYHAWPTNSLDASQIESGEDRGFVINRETARALQGVFDNDTYRDLNPEAIPFIEFTRYSPVTGAPVNPFQSGGNEPDNFTRAYKVLFDTNGDRQIEIPGSDPDASALPRTNIIASVAVWTLIPGTRTSDSSGNTEKQQDVLFGSWDSFSVK